MGILAASGHVDGRSLDYIHDIVKRCSSSSQTSSSQTETLEENENDNDNLEEDDINDDDNEEDLGIMRHIIQYAEQRDKLRRLGVLLQSYQDVIGLSQDALFSTTAATATTITASKPNNKKVVHPMDLYNVVRR